MPREVSGIRCLALGSGDRLFIGTVDNKIWCTFLNGDLDSPLKESGSKLVKVMEVSSTTSTLFDTDTLGTDRVSPRVSHRESNKEGEERKGPTCVRLRRRPLRESRLYRL